MKNKATITLITITCLFAFLCMPGSAFSATDIKWVSYDQAKTLLQKKTDKIFLYFYSLNCYYCSLMEKNTFSNSSVAQYINQNFIPIKVNSDKEKQIAAAYRIRGNPTNYFLTEKFEVIGQLPGYLPPNDLLNILKFIHTESFQKMTYDEFMKKNKPRQ